MNYAKIYCIKLSSRIGACTGRVFWSGVELLTSREQIHPDLTFSLADASSGMAPSFPLWVAKRSLGGTDSYGVNTTVLLFRICFINHYLFYARRYVSSKQFQNSLQYLFYISNTRKTEKSKHMIGIKCIHHQLTLVKLNASLRRIQLSMDLSFAWFNLLSHSVYVQINSSHKQK